MSLSTRIRGYTAWANLRMEASGCYVSNVLAELFTGTNLRALLLSLAGHAPQRLQGLDGLTEQQKETRARWFVEELKRAGVVAADTSIDARMFALGSNEHVFDLFWDLVARDIWFTWERSCHLQLDDDEALCSIPFKWTPRVPATNRSLGSLSSGESNSLLRGTSGFESLPGHSLGSSPKTSFSVPPESEPFPGHEEAKRYNKKIPKGGREHYPSPEKCILNMVNAHLKVEAEGRQGLLVSCMEDLLNSAVLCGLVNIFIPETLPTELLPNDRWTMNLALRTMEEMLHISTSFAPEDLVEADPEAVCVYFCFLFMGGYRLRQNVAVARRKGSLVHKLSYCEHRLESLPVHTEEPGGLQSRLQLLAESAKHQQELDWLEISYPTGLCEELAKHVKTVQRDTRRIIARKADMRFEVINVPRAMTVADLSVTLAVDLSSSFGFCCCTATESCPPDRRIVLRQRDTGRFFDSVSKNKKRVLIRKMLKLPLFGAVDLNPAHHPRYDIYFENTSKSKRLGANTKFLYEVFASDVDAWRRALLRAVQEPAPRAARGAAAFLRVARPALLDARDPSSGDAPLHVAARRGHVEIAECLLQNGADVDARNKTQSTAFSLAVEASHRTLAQLLIEWGCAAGAEGGSVPSSLDGGRTRELRKQMLEYGEFWRQAVSSIMNGDTAELRAIVGDHISGKRQLTSLSCRCINGSSLLHTAAHFGDTETIQDLLGWGVDVNLLDYRDAMPLHRARHGPATQLLLEHGGAVNVLDADGNSAMHMRCYGEPGQPSALDAARLLLESGASLLQPNNRGLLPWHCAAMQGRSDMLALLLAAWTGSRENLVREVASSASPSPAYLATACGFLTCARWLFSQGFPFKESEADKLLLGILRKEIELDDPRETVEFLLNNGASVNAETPQGDSPLHLAAPECPELVELLMEHGAAVDGVDASGQSPLFQATRTGSMAAAALMLSHGADVKMRDSQGLTAFDYIHDHAEWIESRLFTDETVTWLKAYELKQGRDLIKSITRKLQVRKRSVQSSGVLQSQLSKTFGDSVSSWIKSMPPLCFGSGFQAVLAKEVPRNLSLRAEQAAKRSLGHHIDSSAVAVQPTANLMMHCSREATLRLNPQSKFSHLHRQKDLQSELQSDGNVGREPRKHGILAGQCSHYLCGSVAPAGSGGRTVQEILTTALAELNGGDVVATPRPTIALPYTELPGMLPREPICQRKQNLHC
ncbi:unnamed protein product [Lampetra fluviatilis]